MITDDQSIHLTVKVPDNLAGRRLDQIAAELFADYSRARLQKWIREGGLLVNGELRKPKDKLLGSEIISVNVELKAEISYKPEAISLDIVYEDETLLVIDKPAGLVVHPAAGNQDGTLLNALLHHAPALEAIPRAGIVHRLDKDTTGLMVVAKTLPAHHDLVKQLQDRSVRREYEAVAHGVMTGGGTVDAAIGRHPRARTKMAVLAHGGKHAVTHYRVLQRFEHHSHIRVKLETGRTHQIRVHMAHIHYPLVGDGVYAGRLRLPPGASDHLIETLRGFKRQALHAAELELTHPQSGELQSWRAELPADFQQLLSALKAG